MIRVRAVEEGVAAAALREGVAALQAELGVTPDFPPEVEEAAAAAAASPRMPDLDRTDIPFLTIDPATARDLDQAMHLERDGTGYVVHYAIADVAAFVTAGDPVDVEAHRRGETLYGADSKVPLHPKAISEDAGSLLPGEVRPAILWTIRVDAAGEGTSVTCQRARVRSTVQLSYEEAQRQIDAGTAPETLSLLAELGPLRIARERARGAMTLPIPDQEISVDGDRWSLSFRTLLPVEEWNAQVSLLTGMAAAHLMVEGRVGLLRTLPPPDPRDLQRLRRTARALQVPWPDGTSHQELIRSLDPTEPHHAALIDASTSLLRGSGYVAFDGELPEQRRHEALAAEYAHVTAPLRRLADRYALEVCVALSGGTPVPGLVRDALPALPKEMQASAQRASRYERGVLDLVEAGALSRRVGEEFDGVVTDVDDRDPRRGTVTIQDPAIEGPLTSTSDLPLGTDVRVRLETADVAARKVGFALVPGAVA